MIRLNKNKNIGSVIYIVEGAKTEQYIIKRIFNELLGYDLIQVSTNSNIKRFRSKSNKYSRITVITSKHPQIVSLEKYEDYFDVLYQKLAIDYGLDVENSAIYYIFDRDRQSNPIGVIKNMINKYSNAYDNGNEMNGILLLSYPSVESYYLNGYHRNINFQYAKDAKRYIRKYHYDIIDEKIIKNSCKRMIEILLKNFNIRFNIDMVEDFKITNEDILNFEENYYFSNKEYITLSSLSISLLDLGILEIR